MEETKKSSEKARQHDFRFFVRHKSLLPLFTCMPKAKAPNNYVEIDRGILGHVYDYIELENRK